jgi:exoribonuclease R
VISQQAGSLLAEEARPAVLFVLDLDARGALTATTVRRARVRSRAQLDYPSVQGQADAGTLPDPLALLPEIGRLLQRGAAERGAVELGTPEQEVVAAPGGGWTLELRGDLPVEGWNAEISLLTGRCAAAHMLDARVGLLRTLPPARPEDVDRLRQLAPALGVAWPPGAAPGQVISGVDPARPTHAAFLEEAATLLRGAAYTPFDGGLPEQPVHSGVAAPYAHVTAPLRRLVDRFGSVVCLALSAGGDPDDGGRAALPVLPALMAASDRRTRDVERAAIDATEAWLLRGREGEVFSAVVVDAGNGKGTVALDGPAVRGRCEGAALVPGSRVRVRLEEADVAGRSVRFRLAESS